MRQFKIPNQNMKNLSTFKKQVEGILKKINRFDEADKNEALTYLKQCIDGDATSSNCNEAASDSSPPRVLKTRSKAPRKPFKRKKLDAKVKCKICFAAKNKLALFKHLETHVGTPVTCMRCKRSFNNRASFDWHLKRLCRKNRIAVETNYKCIECPREFKVKRHLDKHVEGHKRNNCSYCDVVITNRKHLVRHMLENHSIKMQKTPYKCEHCEKRFVKQRSLHHHMRHHVPNKLVCPECGHVSETQDDFSQHKLSHDLKKPWKCTKCNDLFSRKQQYLYHMKRHDRYKCVTCDETFASKLRIYQHKQQGHETEGLEIPVLHCPQCPKVFYRPLTLQTHMKKHTGDKTVFNCKQCEKTFSTSQQYYKHCLTITHDRISTETNQLICENCGKQFKKKYLLDQHIQRIHNEKRQTISCNYCEYKTYNRTNMDRHLSLHLTHEKQFICEQCGKDFLNLGTLKDHVSYMHLEQKQFKCDKCEKTFKRNSELVRHVATHSDVRPHVCEACGSCFKRSTHLKRHERSVHKAVPTTRRVQRLKKDSSGALVPVQIETKSPPKGGKKPEKPKNNSEQIYAVIDQYYSVSDSNAGDMIALNQGAYSQEELWNNEINLSNADSHILTPGPSLEPQGSELQALSIVDQLVNSFMPSKDINMAQNTLYGDYNGSELDFCDLAAQQVTTDCDNVLTTTERILQGQEREVVIINSLNNYMQDYHYMQQ